MYASVQMCAVSVTCVSIYIRHNKIKKQTDYFAAVVRLDGIDDAPSQNV